MNYHLVSAIIKGIWAIDPETALSYAPLLKSIAGDSAVNFEFDRLGFKPSFYNRVTGDTFTFESDEDPEIPEKENNIAIVPLKGPLMKNDQYCGPVGMATIGEWIKELDSSPKVDGIILKIDSPGGTVDGTAALSEIISNTKKPVIAFVDGLMASAALWIGAAADEVIASSNKDMIGSIGVILSFIDMQPAYEKLGVKFHNIVADQSKDKNKVWEDLRQGNYDQYKKDVLNPLAEYFINHVKSKRPDVTDKELTGKVFFAQDLIGSLVDSIGNMDYALERINSIINENSSKSNKNNNSATMKKYEAINGVIGAELQSTEEGAHLSPDNLEAVNSAIEAGNTASASVKEANDKTATAEAAQKKAEADLAAANETIKAHEAKIEKLQNNPGAESAKVVTQKDKVITDGDKNVTSDNKSFMENVDAVAEEFLG